MLNVALCFDRRFLAGAIAVIASAARHRAGGSTCFHLLTPEEDASSAVAAVDVARSLGATCHLDLFDDRRLDGWPSTPALPVATFRRLFQPALLAGRCERYVYLDTDVLVRADLEALLDESLNAANAVPGHIVAAVRDEGYKDLREALGHRGESLPNPNAPYVNCGVLAINPSLWESVAFTDRCEEDINRWKSDIRHGDQDVINRVLSEQPAALCLLDERWNVQVGALDWRRRRTPRVASEGDRYQRLMNAARVLHFVGPAKPWSRKWSMPRRRAWFDVSVQGSSLA